MPGPYFISRASAAAATAINTLQSAPNDPTATSAGAVQVPNDLGVGVMAYLGGGFSVSTWTATSVGSIFHIRFVGNGINAGVQDVTVEGLSSITASPGTMVANIQFAMPLAFQGRAIPVSRGNTFSVSFAIVSGVAVGTWSGDITMVLI